MNDHAQADTCTAVAISNTPPTDKRSLQRLFLAAYKDLGTIKWACQKIGVRMGTVYDWADKSPGFAKMLEETGLKAEKMLLKRYEGKIDSECIGVDDDAAEFNKVTAILAMFRMKRLDPRYRDNVQVNVETKGPTQLIFEVHTTTGSGDTPK